MNKTRKKQLVSIGIVLVFLISSFSIALTSAIPTTGQPQSGWVARIRIVANNELQTIPAGIGIADSKMDKIVTNDYNGLIYKPVADDVTLGDFFDIWGENFSSECILEYCNTNTSSLRLYVNNVENYEYENYVIKNGDDIRIDYR